MSHVLNCIWVALALWAFARWACRFSRGGSARRTELSGLVCALALLFPVISDNDDLVQQQLWNTPVSKAFKNLTRLQPACDNGAMPEGSARLTLFRRRAALELPGDKLAGLQSTTFSGATGDRSPPRSS